MNPIKISCVSYLNSVPFVYGLKNHAVWNEISLQLDNPSECAFKLRENIVDIGLVPVATIETIPGAMELSGWCIGADGPVQSVTLLSQVPLDKIEKVLLDFQSVTSNKLTGVLAKRFWKIEPLFVATQPGFEKMITDHTAGVVIGDRSLDLQHNYKFVYDLSAEWKKFTGLPFVFARWVSNKALDEGFLIRFDEALSLGINQIDSVINELKRETNYKPGTEDYLKNKLSYKFDELKQRGMELFLEYAKDLSVTVVTASR